MQRREEANVSGADLDSLVEVLGDAPVSVAVLYGSLARGDVGPGSDIDIAVGFEDTLSASERTEARLSLLRDLTVELGTDEVDVVPLSGLPSELEDEIQQDGILLVGTRTDFERYLSDVDSTANPGETRPLGEIVDELEEVV